MPKRECKANERYITGNKIHCVKSIQIIHLKYNQKHTVVSLTKLLKKMHGTISMLYITETTCMHSIVCI